jgi:hypothetical protein
VTLRPCRLPPGLGGEERVVRTMFLAYWFMILGGLILWIAVGLTVE